MKSKLRYCSSMISVLSSIALSGCETYPLPSDVIGISTEQIVVRVRCEMRDAIREAVLTRIEREGASIVYQGTSATDLVAKVRSGRMSYSSMLPEKFNGRLYYDFKRYAHAQINYDFTLQGAESNTQGSRLDLVRTFPGGRADTIGFNSGIERTRDVKRNFRVFDDFTELARKYSNQACEEVRHIDLVYPIGGQKRIYDLVGSFLGINQGQNLAGTTADPITPTMADTLTFTTKLSGSVSPGFALAPTGPGLLLSGLAFTNNNYRQDIHTLIISLTLPTDDPRLIGTLKYGLSYRKYTVNQLRQISGDAALDQQRQRNFQDAVVQFTSNPRFPF